MRLIWNLYWMLRRRWPFRLVYQLLLDPLKTWSNQCVNLRKHERKLEIGASSCRLPGFETLNIVGGPRIDYVLDAARRLPFPDRCFDLIYASHVLEHIPWFQTRQVLQEWVRILKPGGRLELWVPDGMKIWTVLEDAEHGKTDTIPDEWCTLNPDRDPYLWVCGRLFWGGNPAYSSWHRSLFTEGYLRKLLTQAGLIEICVMDAGSVRGEDHGWINLGVRGVKP